MSLLAEYLKENGDEGNWPEFYGGHTRDGRKIKVGNLKELYPGDEDTFMSYDLPWANASNSPFRLFKSWVHEGGIATPFIVHWPAGMSALFNNDVYRIHHGPWIIMDIVATCCELGGIPIPSYLEGESFLPVLHGKIDLQFQLRLFYLLTKSYLFKDKPPNEYNHYFGSIKGTAQ